MRRRPLTERLDEAEAYHEDAERERQGQGMRRFWDEHSLTIIIAVMAVATLAAGVWATWVEYVHNEQGTADGHHVFWSTTFAAYFGMQVFMNFLPELMGLLTIVLLTKRFRERFSAESD
jgi:hypothetical protein